MVFVVCMMRSVGQHVLLCLVGLQLPCPTGTTVLTVWCNCWNCVRREQRTCMRWVCGIAYR